jgi:hypothetical protein
MLTVPAYGSASRPDLEALAALTQCFLYLAEYRWLSFDFEQRFVCAPIDTYRFGIACLFFGI